MLQTIIDAIKNHQILSFTYDNYQRVIEPHAVGCSHDGNDVLLCFQLQGGHVTPGHDWNFCEISKISNLKTTGENFANAHAGYNEVDKGMSNIYAEL